MLLLVGCESGDDLSQPLPELPPVSEWTFEISGTAVISGDTTFVMDYWEDNLLVETEFYAVLGDTIFLRGTQVPGSQINEDSVSFSPLIPAVGSQWWGPGSNRYTVLDSAEITVPAGVFSGFILQISDSATDDQLGTLVLSENNGILAMVQTAEGDTTQSIVLDSYAITGGTGVLPLSTGNRWTLVEGVYEE
jgi:hypothetical protein